MAIVDPPVRREEDRIAAADVVESACCRIDLRVLLLLLVDASWSPSLLADSNTRDDGDNNL